MSYRFTTANRDYDLSDLTDAGLSFVPTYINSEGDYMPLFKYSKFNDEVKLVKLDDYDDYDEPTMLNMKGIQIFTGRPTFKNCETHGSERYNYRLHLTDIDIERKMVDNHIEHVKRIGEVYRENIDGNACITITKSGGYRLSAYAPYLEPKRFFVDGQGDMLIEIFSIMGMSRYDNRYRIAEGCILDMPKISREALLQIYHIADEIGEANQYRTKSNRRVIGAETLNDLDIEWHDHHKFQVSQLFPTEVCPITNHTSNREEVRFSKYDNGAISGICFNCGETWWAKTNRRMR